jgi:hypothetical protein
MLCLAASDNMRLASTKLKNNKVLDTTFETRTFKVAEWVAIHYTNCNLLSSAIECFLKRVLSNAVSFFAFRWLHQERTDHNAGNTGIQSHRRVGDHVSRFINLHLFWKVSNVIPALIPTRCTVAILDGLENNKWSKNPVSD